MNLFPYRLRKYGIFFLVLLTAGATLSARTWEEIVSSGKLRVLTLKDDLESRGLQRTVMPIDRQKAILHRFAERYKLRIEYVCDVNFPTLFSLLDADKGDVIAAGVAATPERRQKYLLSVPFDYTREIVFGGETTFSEDHSPRALIGKKGRILPGTTYEENFRKFAAGVARIDFDTL
ncbi:MAG: transporter substrate-binding domain-containing protein, partial [Victivallaceae bacterium]|nr:transporter substrate-binding domain-containing protein [Victivallaceae bacterium]